MPGVWSWSGASTRRCVSSTVRLDLIFQGVKWSRGVCETAGDCSWHFPGSGGAERRASVSDLQTDIHSIVSVFFEWDGLILICQCSDLCGLYFLLRRHVLKIRAAKKKLGIRRAHSVIGDSPITEWMCGESHPPPSLPWESSRFFIHLACLGFSFPYCCLAWRGRWKNSQICWIYFMSLWVNHQEKNGNIHSVKRSKWTNHGLFFFLLTAQ